MTPEDFSGLCELSLDEALIEKMKFVPFSLCVTTIRDTCVQRLSSTQRDDYDSYNDLISHVGRAVFRDEFIEWYTRNTLCVVI